MSATAPAAAPRWPWLPRLLRPSSLAGRTALVLLLGLMAVQVAGLTIHALDRVDLQRLAQARETWTRLNELWRALASVPPEQRGQALQEVDLPSGVSASLDESPLAPPGVAVPPPVSRLLLLPLPPPPPFLDHRGPRGEGPPEGFGRPPERYGRREPPPNGMGPPRLRPRELRVAHPDASGQVLISARFADGDWLNVRLRPAPPRPWHSETFLIAFVLMTVAAVALTLWAVRRLTRPVGALAAAAERLGRDVNAPPLPEQGPDEVATAARAFNTMAERIRRFVGDRTQMLAAIGHDLRTPITRLRLRAEFMEDDEQRRKMLADLEEMEAMITATLAFARDDAAAEPSSPVDLAALCRTVLDEAQDAHPEAADSIGYEGPERLAVQARPVALKRALANLVGNALLYGGSARITLAAPPGQPVLLEVLDDGPGIPADQLEAVFQPFRRLEQSRNRETGGTGLGLTIARNILRAHGGDVVLRRRPEGGTRALVSLPN